MNLFRNLVIIQSGYTFVTAVWPLVHIESFIYVTGPKQDVWLVKTVGALLIPIAVTLASFLYFDTNRAPAILLGALTALAFISIDVYYSLKNVISDIYLYDAVLELMFLIGWVYIFSRVRQQ
jgi:hypothetical protein